LRFVPSAVPEILGVPKFKAGHVTQATLPCDLILYFWISTSWSPVELQISTWFDLLFWRYCHCNILAFWATPVICINPRWPLPTFKFWDPLNISGTAKAKNLKFGVRIDYDACYSKNAKLGDKMGVA